MNKVQQKFEEWANVEGLRLERQKNMCGGDMGRYEFGTTQAAFEVWIDAWTESRKDIVIDLPPQWYSSQEDAEIMLVCSVISCLDKLGVSYK